MSNIADFYIKYGDKIGITGSKKNMENKFNKSEKFLIAKCIALEVLAVTGDRPQKLTSLCNDIYEDLLNEPPELKEKIFDERIRNL